jgi:hypothetical protein
VQADEVHQRADRRQALVSGRHGTTPFLFQVSQELPDVFG